MTIPALGKITTSYVSTNIKGASGFSNNTKAYLNELKQKYPKMNITIASFNTERQFDNYIWGSIGSNYNIAISGNILEKMASNPAIAAKYEKIFEDYEEGVESLQKVAEKNGSEILGQGAVIDKDGKVTYWAIGRTDPKVVEKQLKTEEKVKKEREDLKEKQILKSKSIKELLEKIAQKSREEQRFLAENIGGLDLRF